MFYNTSDVSNLNTQNATLDVAVAEKYLINFEKYPLEPDIVFSIFSWEVIYREKKLVALISNKTVSVPSEQIHYGSKLKLTTGGAKVPDTITVIIVMKGTGYGLKRFLLKSCYKPEKISERSEC
jgi:hypothetical protein